MATAKKAVKTTEKKEKKPNQAAKRAAVAGLLTKKDYTVAEAATLLPKIATGNFKNSLDLNVVIKLKAKQENESVRGSIVFPVQFGEQKKVLVMAEGEKVKEALEAGAEYAGLEDLVKKIEGGWFDFDVVIAQPSLMVKIAKLGKVLGPKQLMPNPKTGTVTDNIGDTVKMYKSGKIDFKMDAGKNVKVRFGFADMSTEDIAKNLTAAIDSIKNETRKLGPDSIAKMIVKPTMGAPLRLSK